MYLYRDKYFAWTRRRRKVERTKGTRQIFGGGRGQEEKHNGFDSHTRNYIDCSDAYFLRVKSS